MCPSPSSSSSSAIPLRIFAVSGGILAGLYSYFRKRKSSYSRTTAPHIFLSNLTGLGATFALGLLGSAHAQEGEEFFFHCFFGIANAQVAIAADQFDEREGDS